MCLGLPQVSSGLRVQANEPVLDQQITYPACSAQPQNHGEVGAQVIEELSSSGCWDLQGKRVAKRVVRKKRMFSSGVGRASFL